MKRPRTPACRIHWKVQGRQKPRGPTGGAQRAKWEHFSIQLHPDEVTAKSWLSVTKPSPPPSWDEGGAGGGWWLLGGFPQDEVPNLSVSKAAMEQHWDDKYWLENNAQVRHNWSGDVLFTSLSNSWLKQSNQLDNFFYLFFWSGMYWLTGRKLQRFQDRGSLSLSRFCWAECLWSPCKRDSRLAELIWLWLLVSCHLPL